MKKTLIGILYWVGQLTWGLLTTSIGLLVSLFIIILGGKVRRNGFSFIVEIGGDWGGLEAGAVSFMGRYSEICPEWGEHTRRHEAGHSLQNLIWGPLFPFIIMIPSACRYWYCIFMSKKGKKFAEDWYNSFWIERHATNWGTNFIKYVEGEKK